MLVGSAGGKQWGFFGSRVSKQELHYRFLHFKLMAKIQMQSL